MALSPPAREDYPTVRTLTMGKRASVDWLGLKAKVKGLLDAMHEAEQQNAAEIAKMAQEKRATIRNFIHYLALRQLDVRPLQLELADLGLSSFGRSEGYVMSNLQAIADRIDDTIANRQGGTAYGPSSKSLDTFSALELRPQNQSIPMEKSEPRLPKPVSTARRSPGETSKKANELTWRRSETILHRNTRALFGPKPENRHVYIMVTAPGVASANEIWLDSLLKAGMNILRINAAHESVPGIKVLIAKARQRALLLNRPLKILVDIPGPKLRTQVLSPGLAILKLRPQRAKDGHVIKPCLVEIHTSQDSLNLVTSLPQLVFSGERGLAVGDVVKFKDARHKKRSITIVEQKPTFHGIFVGLLDQTSYLNAQTEVQWHDSHERAFHKGSVSHTYQIPWTADVAMGELFALVKNDVAASQLPQPLKMLPQVASLPEIFDEIVPGTQVIFDDGKVISTAMHVFPEGVILKVTQALKGVARIRGEMGINIPEAHIKLPAISPEDRVVIDEVKDLVDLLGISFVRTLADVHSIKDALGDSNVPIMLKVETKSCFQNLPEILLSIIKNRNMAVMIARGDLAVECGFERLAEVQEEILWLSEAAHLPVIWATQVLETLAKTGIPTRAEITDAAMAVRAECVMLNKGQFITQAVESLNSILMRMEGHQYKKRQLFRPLALNFPARLDAIH